MQPSLRDRQYARQAARRRQRTLNPCSYYGPAGSTAQPRCAGARGVLANARRARPASGWAGVQRSGEWDSGATADARRHRLAAARLRCKQRGGGRGLVGSTVGVAD